MRQARNWDGIQRRTELPVVLERGGTVAVSLEPVLGEGSVVREICHEREAIHKLCPGLPRTKRGEIVGSAMAEARPTAPGLGSLVEKNSLRPT